MFLRVGATTEEEEEGNMRKQHTLVRPERENESEHCGWVRVFCIVNEKKHKQNPERFATQYVKQ